MVKGGREGGNEVVSAPRKVCATSELKGTVCWVKGSRKWYHTLVEGALNHCPCGGLKASNHCVESGFETAISRA